MWPKNKLISGTNQTMDIFSQRHILWLKRYQLLSLQLICFQAWEVNFHLLSGFLWTRLLKRKQYYEANHYSAQWCCTLQIWDSMAFDKTDQFWAFLKLPHMVECGYFSGLFFDKNSPSIMGRGSLDNQPKLIYSILMWWLPWDMSKLCFGDI